MHILTAIYLLLPTPVKLPKMYLVTLLLHYLHKLLWRFSLVMDYAKTNAKFEITIPFSLRIYISGMAIT